jgi:hypothetical protein
MDGDRKLEIVEKVVGGVVEKMTGIDFVGGTLGFLRDPKDRDPVVPPDLHLVVPAKVDADGNITCVWCKRLEKWEAAQMIGSAGFACAACARMQAAPALGLPENLSVRRRVWPWFLGAGVLGVAVIAVIVHHERAQARAELEAEYPVANSASDDALIDRALERWKPARVLAEVAAPPSLASLKLGTACDYEPNALSLEARVRDDDELGQQLKYLFANAKRGRYTDEWSHAQTVLQIAGPVLVVAVAEEAKPEMKQRGEKLGYIGGHRAGTAYVYDIDGTLKCAGTYDAESSKVVKYTSYDVDSEAVSTTDRRSAHDAVDYDLDEQTRSAIVAGLHRVE